MNSVAMEYRYIFARYETVEWGAIIGNATFFSLSQRSFFLKKKEYFFFPQRKPKTLLVGFSFISSRIYVSKGITRININWPINLELPLFAYYPFVCNQTHETSTLKASTHPSVFQSIPNIPSPPPSSGNRTCSLEDIGLSLYSTAITIISFPKPFDYFQTTYHPPPFFLYAPPGSAKKLRPFVPSGTQCWFYQLYPARPLSFYHTRGYIIDAESELCPVRSYRQI